MKISVLDSLTLGGDLDLSPLKKYGELKIYSSTDTEETPSHCMDSDILVINKVKIKVLRILGLLYPSCRKTKQ